jgi:hypothetical protein
MIKKPGVSVKKKTVKQKRPPTKHTVGNRPATVAEVLHSMNTGMGAHFNDINQLVQVLLARCDVQDKAIGKLELNASDIKDLGGNFGMLASHCHAVDQHLEALILRCNRQDKTMERMVGVMTLMLSRLERFCKEKAEPALLDSIRNDLKTPTVECDHWYMRYTDGVVRCTDCRCPEPKDRPFVVHLNTRYENFAV